MADVYVIDTHALLWYLDDNARLGQRARSALIDPESRFLVPAIALAEALFILEKGRTSISITETDLINALRSDERIGIAPLNQDVIEATLNCKAIDEIHDRQIVATALVAQDDNDDISVPVLTRDANIRDSGLVNIIW